MAVAAVGGRGYGFVHVHPNCTNADLCACALACHLHGPFSNRPQPSTRLQPGGVGAPCFTRIYFIDISKNYEIYVHVHRLMSTMYFYKQYLASNLFFHSYKSARHSIFLTAIHLVHNAFGIMFVLTKLFSYLCISIFVLVFSLSLAHVHVVFLATTIYT